MIYQYTALEMNSSADVSNSFELTVIVHEGDLENMSAYLPGT